MLSFSRLAASLERITSARAATVTVTPAIRSRRAPLSARSAAEIVVASRAGRQEHQVEMADACGERPTVGGRKHLGFDRERHTVGGACASQLRVEVFCGTIIAVDRQKFGLEACAEDTRLAVAGCTSHGTAPQGAVDVNRAAGHNFGA